MNRALPSTIIDLIRGGAPPWDLKRRGDKAVWSALCRTAGSALQREWTYPEWADLIDTRRSHLGTQVRLKNGRKERSDHEVEETLSAAWKAAETWLAEAPEPYTRDDVDAKLAELRDLIADPDVGLGDADRVVLGYALERAEARGTDRPTVPRGEVVKHTGLGDRTVRNSLARLEKAGLLRCEVRGRSGGPNTRERRANAYRLPEPSVLAAMKTEPPAKEPAMPAKERTHRSDYPVITNISARHLPAETMGRLAALLAAEGVEFTIHNNTQAGPVETSTGNVVPLRKGRTA